MRRIVMAALIAASPLAARAQDADDPTPVAPTERTFDQEEAMDRQRAQQLRALRQQQHRLNQQKRDMRDSRQQERALLGADAPSPTPAAAPKRGGAARKVSD